MACFYSRMAVFSDESVSTFSNFSIWFLLNDIKSKLFLILVVYTFLQVPDNIDFIEQYLLYIIKSIYMFKFNINCYEIMEQKKKKNYFLKNLKILHLMNSYFTELMMTGMCHTGLKDMSG